MVFLGMLMMVEHHILYTVLYFTALLGTLMAYSVGTYSITYIYTLFTYVTRSIQAVIRLVDMHGVPCNVENLS